jgi:hypothetical protein
MKLSVNYRNITGTLPVIKLTPNTGHQKPHSLQPNQIYGNLVTNIPKS